MLVFVPLFALPGIEGRLFAPLGIAYIVSILASLLVSLTVTPVLCYYLLPKMKRAGPWRQPAGGAGSSAGTRGCCTGRSTARKPLLALAALAVAGWRRPPVPFFPRAFLPPFNEGTLTHQRCCSIRAPRWPKRTASARLAEQLIAQVPEVTQVGRRTGRAELDEHAEGVHYSRDRRGPEALASARREAIMADIRDRLAVLPAAVNIGQPISHRLDHLLSGVRAQIALKIFGDDLDTLRGLAEQTARAAGRASPAWSTCRSRSRC